MNGHKAFKEIPDCQIEVNAYITVKANPLMGVGIKHLESFHNDYIPMDTEEIPPKPHTFLNLMGSP